MAGSVHSVKTQLNRPISAPYICMSIDRIELNTILEYTEDEIASVIESSVRNGTQ